MSGRSEPGKGEPVLLWVGDSGQHGDMLADPEGDAVVGCAGTPVEDFSTCGWPVCVKVKPVYDKDSAARLLRKIADWIEKDGTQPPSDPGEIPF